jgi:hypothetical protein
LGFLDYLPFAQSGRRKNIPERETVSYPQLQNPALRILKTRYLYKPTPRNIRYFSHTPYARRAINAIKNPISMLDWEIIPVDDEQEINAELQRQIDVVTTCFNHPNQDDSFSTLLEQVVEDYLIGAAAVELQLSPVEQRPLWLWPVDGLSIQIYPGWEGKKNEARYAQVIGYGTAFGGGVTAELTNEELMYIKPNASSATPFGFGSCEIAFNTINNLLGTAEFAGNVASNQRSSIAMSLNGMDSRIVEAFRSYWQNEIEGQGKVPIISFSPQRSDEKNNSAFEVHRLYPEGDSGLYLEYQNFLIRTLAQCFDLSPQNFGVEADVNRNTSETASDRDWDQAIKPCAFKIAQHLTRDAIHTRLGFSQLCFRFKGIEREDELAVAERYKIYYEGNAFTPNEHRTKIGEAPCDNEFSDMLYADVQIAMAAAKGAAQVDDKNLGVGTKKKASK